MPTYRLNGHDRITIARRPIKVTVSSAGPPGQVVLGARRGAEPDLGAQHPRPGEMILPNVVGETVVRVTPGPSRDMFLDGTVVSVTLSTQRSRDADEDVVLVLPIDVSSRFHRDVVAVDLDGGRLSVTALDVVVDRPLPPLPAAARGAARACLGVDRLPEPVDVVMAVDTSASMVPAFLDGSVAAAVDVLAGLSQVIGRDREPLVYLIGEGAHPLPETPLAELTATTVAAMERFGFGCGCRGALPEPAGSTGAFTFIVADAVPADIATPGATGPADPMRHVVLLGPRETHRPRSGEPTLTVIPPPPEGMKACAHLMSAPGLLVDVMRSLLAGLGSGERHEARRESA
jgi:hypothetical protein